MNPPSIVYFVFLVMHFIYTDMQLNTRTNKVYGKSDTGV